LVERKDAKVRKQHQEQLRRHEEQLCHALRVWNTEILPNWDVWLAVTFPAVCSKYFRIIVHCWPLLLIWEKWMYMKKWCISWKMTGWIATNGDVHKAQPVVNLENIQFSLKRAAW